MSFKCSSRCESAENLSYSQSDSSPFKRFENHLAGKFQSSGLEIDECECATRGRVEDYMLQEELDNFMKIGKKPEFEDGELYQCIDNEKSDVSFRSLMPDSEIEFLSDTEICPDNEIKTYIPPLTKTKMKFIEKLSCQQIDETDTPETVKLKRYSRLNAILEYKSNIMKERTMKAFLRLQFVKTEELPNVKVEAEVLKQMELLDKKLNRKYYYEETEPNYYKKLLKKRIRAIKRKFELYTLDPCFRKKYENRVIFDACSVKQESYDNAEIKAEAEADAIQIIKPCVSRTNFHEPKGRDYSLESEDSSIYDYDIALSEAEYFSSPPPEEMVQPTLNPKSRRRNKLRRYEKQFTITAHDNDIEKHQKMLNVAKVRASFINYCEREKAYKALTRHKAIQDKGNMSPLQQADMFTRLEIEDKKLHRNYYWWPNEPDCYKLVLAKRRRAIVRKYNRYATDSNFRQQFVEQIYINYFGTCDKTLFDSLSSDENSEDESSFNDTDIPTSEEEFMEKIEYHKLPNFRKPITRTAERLYDDLECYEQNRWDSKEDMILKRKTRVAVIQLFKNILADRRQRKALKRLEIATKLCNNDPNAMAMMLTKLEKVDKKLDRKFYYAPNEPKEFKMILLKRLHAINCKFQRFAKDPEFRKAYEYRIRNAMDLPPKELKSDEDISLKTIESVYSRPEISQHRSFNPDRFKKERIREIKTAGIHKKLRDTAPAILQEEPGDRNQSCPSDYEADQFYMARKGYATGYDKNLIKCKYTNNSLDWLSENASLDGGI